MKTLKVAVIVLLAAVVINVVRGPADFPLPHILPLSGGFRPGIYDLGALGMILLCLWGLVRVSRLGRPRDEDSRISSTSDGYEEVDDDEDIDDRPEEDSDA
ncbi:hypothetical protein [Anaerobaca lacustris]|uniref:Uncharacterized protein n=1 Tax=Anaerobaca lacustris TaxID=3044600 RepID=A0AAW6U970_9BACT|nr:hypothetical protein [Sedimentisphaerales bacterium M17dextr]